MHQHTGKSNPSNYSDTNKLHHINCPMVTYILSINTGEIKLLYKSMRARSEIDKPHNIQKYKKSKSSMKPRHRTHCLFIKQEAVACLAHCCIHRMASLAR